MKLNRVLVVYKKPSLLRGGVSRRKDHLVTIREVQRVLTELKVKYKILLRDRLKKALPPIDLLITIGGDGTVLAASHVACNIPIFGVNSMPKTSVGFFCAANAKNFRRKFLDIKAGRAHPIKLPLIEASIDGKRLPFLALNDILFAAASPAETVQYTIHAGGKKELQRGSGVWIAAGPGSTAGICSAGGKCTAITSEKIQYLVRELYPIPRVKYHLRRGFVPKGQAIKIFSEMPQGMVFLDGAKLAYPIPRGSILKVRIAPHQLKIFLRR